MSKVKTGSEIQTIKDVKDLATSIILRSDNFNVEKIVSLTKKYSENAQVELTDEKLEEIIVETINLLLNHNKLVLIDGKYFNAGDSLIYNNDQKQVPHTHSNEEVLGY